MIVARLELWQELNSEYPTRNSEQKKEASSASRITIEFRYEGKCDQAALPLPLAFQAS